MTPPRSRRTSPTCTNWRCPTGSPSRHAPETGPGLTAPPGALVDGVAVRAGAEGRVVADGVLRVRSTRVIRPAPGTRACPIRTVGPCHHPGHPTAEKEGCRPASRGYALELMTSHHHTVRLRPRTRPVPRHGRDAVDVTPGRHAVALGRAATSTIRSSSAASR